MTFIKAISLAPDVNEWLASSRQPRILHVFDQACNLINERREVLSIVTPQIGNGPFNLVIPRLRKSFGGLPELDESQQTSEVFPDYLNTRSPISILDDQITLDNLTINTAAAELWNPRPDWEKLHGKREEIFNQLLLLPIPDDEPTLPQSLLTTFSTALANSDLPSAITAAKKLAGLGLGLTPAGDDFILGAILAAWIIHPPEVAGIFAKEITNTAAPLTTSLSAAYLKSAGRGEAGILWHNFFSALFTGDSSDIELQITKLLSVGYTSGADALSGFVEMFMSWMAYGSRSVPGNGTIPSHLLG